MASVSFDAVACHPGAGVSSTSITTEWAGNALAMLMSLTEHQLPPLLQIEPDRLLRELLFDIWRLYLSQAIQVLSDVELVYGLHVQELMD